MYCSPVALHENSTEETSDDPTFGLCVYGNEGDYCFVTENTCQPPYKCVQATGEPDNVGKCEVVPDCTTDSECDDGLACTDDACDSGTCTNTLASAKCLIEGVCYDDQAVSSDGCNICDAAQSTSSWVPATDGTQCDDGDACTDTDI